MFRPLIRPLKHESLFARPEIDDLDVLGTVVDTVVDYIRIGASVGSVIAAGMIVVGSILPPHRGQPVRRLGGQFQNAAHGADALAAAVDNLVDLVKSRHRRPKRRTE